MVLVFALKQKARKMLEKGCLSRVGGQAVDWYRMTASDLRVLGNLECIVDFQS
jgi:hypothetical protein